MTLRDWQDAKGTTSLEADVVVVGTGPGGAAAARVLAEAGRSVVMLEEGPARPMFRPNMAHTMRYHMQEGGSMVALGTSTLTVAAGRGVGGGSLINSAMCWRTPDHILEGWTETLGGDDRYRPEAMAPVFDEIGEIIEITKTSEAIAGENNQLIVRGARALGLTADLLHRNAPGCAGCGVCNYGCPSGGKASVDKNLIVMARAAGAIVQGDCRVHTILVEDGEAVGVVGTIRHQDTGEPVGELTVRAQQVVVAAGAVGTPRLLLQAGLGDVLGDRVGKGLHLHPGNAIMGLCDHEVRMWTGATQAAYYEDPEIPDILPHTLSLPPGALLLALGKVGLEAKETIRMAPYMCGCLVMVSDKGEGTVGITSRGTADLTYHWADVDIDNMRKGLKRTCEVLLAGGAKRLLVPIAGVGWVDTLEEAHAAIEVAGVTDYQAMYAAHPMATCRMGDSIATGVLKPTGETWGVDGLWIADSSVFPTSLGVNPQYTTMTMATIIARTMVATT